MKLTAFAINTEGNLEPCEVDHALSGWRDGSGSFWIHMESYGAKELASWLDRLDLTPFARNRLLKQGEITKVVPLAQGLMLDLRILPDASSDAPKQMAVLCLKGLVLTLEPEGTGNSDSPDRRLETMELMDASTTGVLCSVLLFEAKRVGQEVREIRSRLFDLDGQMDRDPAAVELDRILEAKDRLLKLVSVAVEQRECLEALTACGSEALDFSNLKGTVRLLLSAAGSTERMAERLEKRVTDLRQRYDAHQQEKINHRLAVLTVVSAIFLPLTLIAGIWGMNFEAMPELKYPMAYPIALSLMACIGGGLLWFFHRKGWLR